MQHRSRLPIVLAATLAAACGEGAPPTTPAPAPPSIAGTWRGTARWLDGHQDSLALDLRAVPGEPGRVAGRFRYLGWGCVAWRAAGGDSACVVHGDASGRLADGAVDVSVPYEVCGFGSSGTLCQLVGYGVRGTLAADGATIEGDYGMPPYMAIPLTLRRE